MKSDLPYLRSYPEPLQDQARDLLAQGRLGAVLQGKYPQAHAVRNDRALYDYAQKLKSRYLRNAATVNKVLFDNKDAMRISCLAARRLPCTRETAVCRPNA